MGDLFGNHSNKLFFGFLLLFLIDLISILRALTDLRGLPSPDLLIDLVILLKGDIDLFN